MPDAPEDAPRVLLDECVWSGFSELFRGQGFDIVHIDELDFKGLADDKVLEYAVSQGRIVITEDVGDFIVLASQWYHAGKQHHGIIVSTYSDHALIIKCITNLLSTETRNGLNNKTLFLSDYNINV